MVEEHKIHLEENEDLERILLILQSWNLRNISHHLEAGSQCCFYVETGASTSVETCLKVVANFYSSVYEAPNSKH